MGKALLKVPFAHDPAAGIIWPDHAQKGITYLCPNCQEKLIFRAGEIKRHHFAHKPNGVCSQETVLHKSAKLLVQVAVRAWKLGKAAVPEVVRQCGNCHESSPQPLPGKVTDALLEYRLPDGFVSDVALMQGARAVAAIEVHVTHAVDEKKSERLSIPFVELEAAAVLESPRRWEPIVDNFRPYTCPKCHERLARYVRLTREIANSCKIDLPTSYYRYGLHRCYKCRQIILAFDWPGRDLRTKTPPQQQPVPNSVQYRYVRFVNTEYWVNTCPLCHATQGDNYLFMEPGGPFMGAELSYRPEVIGEEAAKTWRDSAEAFREDILRLAVLADYNGYLT
jgi:uncharacterized protein YlaI